MTLDDLRSQRIGLVLSGGGAKGAYEIGCWKALREAGISDFRAVSGSSVGALNAILVAVDKFELAERLWRELRFRSIVALRPLFLILLPAWLFVVIYRLRQAPVREFERRRYAYKLIAMLWLVSLLAYSAPYHV